MIKGLGIVCIILASLLDIASYYRQIVKILRTKRSSQVSSTAYVFKISKGMFAMVGLCIYANWAGLGMELVMVLVYINCLGVIARYKPRGWKLI